MRVRNAGLGLAIALSLGCTALASGWSAWRVAADGSNNLVEYRFQIDRVDYDGQRLVDLQFRSRYTQRVVFDYEVTLLGDLGDMVERRRLTLNPGEVSGCYILATAVRGVRVRIARVAFDR